MQKVIFIVGVGRSGTTLLQSMLNAHPEICLTPETHFLKKYIVPFLSRKKPSALTKGEALEKFGSDSDLERLNLDLKAVIDGIEEPVTSPKIFRNLLASYAEQQGKEHVGDKDPMNVQYLPHIRHAFPEAYVLHIIRDPRDVMLSRIKSDWGKGRPLLAHVCEHRAHLGKARAEGPAQFGERYRELYYEDLVQTPEETLKKICEQISVSFDPAMLNYQEGARNLVHENEKKWKENVFKPVQKGNSGKWKKGLKKGQIKLIEGTLKKSMEETGYSSTQNGTGWVRFWTTLPLWLCRKAFAWKSRKERVKSH